MDKWIINRIGYILISVMAISGCAEKYELDRKMEVLCKIDGGAKVYEIVTLPDSDFSKNGFPLDRYWGSAKNQEDKLGPDYRYFYKTEWVQGKESNPLRGEGALKRYTEIIYRRSDNKKLGESIGYGRIGGDNYIVLFLYQHPSSNHCPKSENGLLTKVFRRGEQ